MGSVGEDAILRSTTVENLLRSATPSASGRDLSDLLEWNHNLPDEKFVEGLASDMQAIDVAPPDVQTMRTTFTLERILSGAEAELMRQTQLARQHSNACSEGGEGMAGRLGARAERLQTGPHRQDSIHRLAASSGPGSGPGPRGGRGPGLSSLARSTGSGRYGHAAAAAAGPDEDAAPPRSPKRPKHQHGVQAIKAEAAAAPGPNGEPVPGRTWSQSLLELAKAAAALEGKELDEVEVKEEAEPGDREPGPAGAGAQERSAGGDGDGEADQGRSGDGEGRRESEMDGEAGRAGAEGDGGAAGRREGLVRTGSGEAGANGEGEDREPPSGRQRTDGSEPEEGDERRQERVSRQGDGEGRGGAQDEDERPGGRGVGPGPNSANTAAGDGPPLGGPLLRSGSGLRGPQAPPLGPRGPVEPPPPSADQIARLLRLQAEVERLQADNELLNGHLEAVLQQVDGLQQRNAGMKQLLLDACHAKGIQADMGLLNVSLQHHRAQPMPEEQAARIAAGVLGQCGGEVMAAVQQMVGVALVRIAGPPAPLGLGPQGGPQRFL
ncbi:hypothetical protein HYH03_002683 [Edaphochlamys debaryana]|uniref:Uncharacterized protein n=1 Tax=Edaphochlamys debaryana TaxID=47281 RepID=A0A836C438_9CHLO|nr:hypothetical protein HYH03_002683 [Edaphochlamys debaryana]|eukprot:KAG2499751.1 hypothetical protein HYH03_002683 [Edaphochlamys debaryana]